MMGVIAEQALLSTSAAAAISIAAGTFALTGQDVTFRTGVLLSAGAGTFALTGQDVSFPTLSNSVIAGAGTFALTGVDVITVGPFNFIGSLVTNTAQVNNLFTNNTDIAATWDTEIRDTDTIHDTGSNTNRLTIPSALNGRVCIIHATIYKTHSSAAGTSMLMYFKRGGIESFDGTSAFHASNGYNTQNAATLHTAPIVVSTGDIFEVFVKQNSGGSGNLALHSSFGIWVLT